jgi:trigger factor
LIESILKETVLEVPQAMVEREVDIMLDEMSHNLSHSNLTLESYLKSMCREESDLKKELRAPAQARAKAKIVLRAISKQEKIEPEEKEVEAEISKMAVEAGKTLGEFKETLTEDSRQFIKDYLARQKALDFVVEKAKIVEEKE